MADPRFFDRQGPFTSDQLSKIANAELVGDPSLLIEDVASLSDARKANVAFLDNPKYVAQFKETAAGLCICDPKMKDDAPEGISLLITQEPYMAYARVSRAFYPDPISTNSISDNAIIAPTAKIGSNVSIDAGVVIGENVNVGEGCWIKANTVIHDGVTIGKKTTIAANCTIMCAIIGDHVMIHSGCQIGQEGFGFASGPQGHFRIPQLGRVIIHDHVNIGSNTTIDRGAGPDTVIGAGCQIDNLVQIGHNVQMGMGCVIVSQTGISGSTKLGNGVVLGGQTGVAGHLNIGDGVRVAAKSGVTKDIQPGQTIGGFPAILHKDWIKQSIALKKLVKSKS